MESDPPLFTFQEQRGTPFLVDDLVLRPDARVLRLQLRGAGFVWTMPTRLGITHKDGSTYDLSLVDATRLGQIGAVLAGAAAALLLWLLVRR